MITPKDLGRSSISNFGVFLICICLNYPCQFPGVMSFNLSFWIAGDALRLVSAKFWCASSTKC
uniref:Uncharacterized protein n=1 Tax=Arundo donax TaxID=35708 RepID=A0A0A9T0A8_ARUDO